MARPNLLVTLTIIGLGLGTLCWTLPHYYQDSTLPETVFAELDPAGPLPQLQLRAEPLGTGWLLYLETANWVFSDLCGPEQKSTPQGHAHVYLNDEKIGTARLPVYYIDRLPLGPHEITVSLRSTDHRVLVGAEGTISAHITLGADGPSHEKGPAG